MRPKDQKTIELARERLDGARGWIESCIAAIMAEDGDTRPFTIAVAQDNERLELPPVGAPLLICPFRHRRLERSKFYGRPIAQYNFWNAGAPGETEYDRVISHVNPVGELGAQIWDALVGGERVFVAGVIVDLRRFRAILPSRRIAMEQTGPPSPLPFVGFDIAGLMAHDCVRSFTPSVDFFTQRSFGPRNQIEGQGELI